MPAVGGSGASVRCFGTNGWRSRWLWQKRRTTPHEGQKNATAIREEVVQVTHGAPRGQRTPPPGVRPGPQRSDRSLRRSSAEGLPLLATPSLAGAAGEVVDSSSLGFLAASALKRKEREEKEGSRRDVEEKEQKRRELSALLAVPCDRWTPAQDSRVQALCSLVSGGPPSSPPSRRGLFFEPLSLAVCSVRSTSNKMFLGVISGSVSVF